MFKEVLIKEDIIQWPNEWQDSENATMELTNSIANQCQEISKSVNNKVTTECNENNGGNMEENKKKPISSNNQSMKEATSPFATNGLAVASSETKKDTSSQNTS
jgi:fructose-1,6-bisphosphatase